MKFIKKHLALLIILLVFIVLLVVGFIAFKNIFLADNGDQFGSRTSDIKDHPITKADYKKVTDNLKAVEGVSDITYNTDGRHVKFILTVDETIDLVTAKSFADKILENFTDDIKGYYDIEVFLVSKNKENADFPKIGYKSKTSAGYVW
jgi:divalent metal cation (Fe/Co/Zn/Cd) transporter